MNVGNLRSLLHFMVNARLERLKLYYIVVVVAAIVVLDKCLCSLSNLHACRHKCQRSKHLSAYINIHIDMHAHMHSCVHVCVRTHTQGIVLCSFNQTPNQLILGNTCLWNFKRKVCIYSRKYIFEHEMYMYMCVYKCINRCCI